MNKNIKKIIFLCLLITPSKAIAASDNDCYLSKYINTVGKSGTLCEGKLIVDRQMLLNRIKVNKYWIDKNNKRYWFGQNKNGRRLIFTGQINNFNKLFNNKQKFNADISYWDTSRATTMHKMFRNARKFNRNIKNWDVSNVKNMSSMFEYAFKFNKDIGKWETSNVKNFSRMFQNAKKFNQDIGSWDVKSATNYDNMFNLAKKFKQSLNRWNVEHQKSKPKSFAPKLTYHKQPCWGSNGCKSERPILLDNLTMPAQDSVGVDLNARLELTFNVDIQDGPGDIQLWKKEGTKETLQTIRNVQKRNGTSSLQITSKNIKVLDLSLESNSDYFVLIDNNAIKRKGTSYFFEGVSNKDRIFFTTRQENKAPEDVGFSTSIELITEPEIAIRFDENIQLGSGYISLYSFNNNQLIKKYDVTNSENLSISSTGDAVKIDLHDGAGNNWVEPNTKYYLLLDNKAIKDKSNNYFAGISSKEDISFTTGSATCGLISGEYLDFNNNPVFNRNVHLYDSDENLIETVSTDILGRYKFVPPSQGTYKLKFNKKTNEQKKGIKSRVLNVTSSNSGIVMKGRWITNIVIDSDCQNYSDLDALLIDPAGVIYDSSTRQPISGAEVKLYYDGSLVNNDWLDDSGGNNTQTTDSGGEYSFVFKANLASDGVYTIEVTPPTGYIFESTNIPSVDETFIPQLGGQIENIQTQSTAPQIRDDTTYYLSFNFTFTGEASTTSNGVFNNHIPVDDPPPTLSSSVPADNAPTIGVDSNIVLNFSEAVDVESGNITIKKTSDDSTIETIDVTSNQVTGTGTTQITINPSSDLNSETEYYLLIDDTAFDDSTGNSFAGIFEKTTLAFMTVGSDPTLKADVVGLAEAWTNAAIRFSKSSMNAVNRRFDWVRNNRASGKTSVQGITISFANPFLDKAINGSRKRLKDFKTSDFTNWAQRNWSNERLVNQSDAVMENLADSSVNVAFAEIRNQIGDVNLNPKGKSLLGNWSVWTDGQLMIGKKEKSATASKQQAESSDISIGLDKTLGENGLVGIALTLGEENNNIGNQGSRIKSENYSFSIYSSNKYKNRFPLDAQLGLGRMQISTRRLEGISTYRGNRDVNMIFGSAAIHGKSILKGKLEINPYSRIEAAHIHFNKFTESGGPFALTFENQQLTRKILSFGLDLSYDMPFKNWQLRPVGQFEYGLDFTNDSNVDMHYANDSQNYRLQLSKESISYWKASTGLEFYKRNGFSANINYAHQQEGDSIFSNSYHCQVNWSF